MKQHLSLLFTVCSILTMAQPAADTLSMRHALDKTDTLAQNREVSNSYNLMYSGLDSMRVEFNATATSLYAEYHEAIAVVSAERKKIRHTIDSLERLTLPTRKYKKQLADLSDLKSKAEARLNEKLTALKAKTTDKLNALDVPPEYKAPLQKLSQQINEVTLDNEFVKLPALNIPGYDVPTIDAIDNVHSLESLEKQSDIANMVNVQVPAEISEATQQVQEYEGHLGNIPNADITNSETLQKTVEAQASRVDGIDELQKQSSVIDDYKAKLDGLADPAKNKKKAVELAKKAAVDHFAGKEEQLKSAMHKISKYKQQYSSVSSIKDLPKRPPNPMNGKPFIERLVPGMYLQYQRKNFYLLDVNPYVAYKLTGRLSTGLGWNHRFAWDDKTHAFSSRTRIFGPRTYIDFKLGKGFIAHVEGETMNTFVPSTLFGSPDTGERDWVWSFMTGIKKEYRIYKNLKGTALIQYNLFNRYYKAPYVDRLNSRIGFEYVLKKAKKTKAKAVN